MRRILLLALSLLALPAWAAQVATPTLLDSQQNASSLNFSSITTDSIAPSGSALLFACLVADGNLSRTFDSVTDSAITMATEWSTPVYQEVASGTGLPIVGYSWGITDASPGSGTVTATLSGTKSDGMLYVIEVASNYHATTPIANDTFDIAETTSTSPSLTLDETPDADSILLGCISVHDEGSTTGGGPVAVGSGFTEFEAETQIVDEFTGHAQYADGGNGTTVAWDLAGGSPTLQALVAIEVQPAAGGGGAVIPIFQQHQLRTQ